MGPGVSELLLVLLLLLFHSDLQLHLDRNRHKAATALRRPEQSLVSRRLAIATELWQLLVRLQVLEQATAAFVG